MSIIKRKKPIYRATGGVTPLAGEIAQGQLEDKIANQAGDPLVNPKASYDDQINSIIDWSGDTANLPQYYGNSTVAGVGDTLQSGFDQGEFASAAQNVINADLLGKRYDMLDTSGDFSRQLTDEAIAGVNKSWGSTGTFGSARHANATASAVTNALLGNANVQLDSIASIRDALSRPSEAMRGIGERERQIAQEVINEDIKRFNYAQLTPQQMTDRILGLITAREGIAAGNVFTQNTQGGADSSAFHEGGEVYANEGMMMEDPMMPMGGQDQMMNEPQGIVGGGMPQDMPMEDAPTMLNEYSEMGSDMMGMDDMSQIDRIEDTITDMIAATGADITITRTTKKGSK